MRQRDVLQLLQNALRALDAVNPSYDETKTNVYVHNLAQLHGPISELVKNGILVKSSQALMDTWLFDSFESRRRVGASAWSNVSLPFNTLFREIVAMQTAIENLIVVSEETIGVKLPAIKDFNDLAAVSNDLNKAIALPISEPEIGGEVQIKAVDNGSIWLYIALGSATAIGLVGGLLWTAAVVYKKWQEALANREYVKNLSLQNEAFQALVDAQKKTIDEFTEEQIREVENTYFATPDPERTQRLKHSVETFQGLIQKGMEVEPSMLASEQVKNLYPNLAALHFQPAETKQIAGPENTQ